MYCVVNFSTCLISGSASSAPSHPAPVVNAWEKPLQVPVPLVNATNQGGPTSIPVSMIPTGPSVKAPGGKPDSDQHDSGVELNSDHHGSNPSSQRNSPSAESKADHRLMQVKDHNAFFYCPLNSPFLD